MPGSDIVLDDAGVSRRHAALTVEGGEATIEDLGSTNGTRVNGVRLESSRRLVAGDEVRIGAAAVRFETPGSAGAAPTATAATRRLLSPTPTAAPAPAATRAPRRRRVRLGRVVLVGGLANLVLLAAGVVINFATDWTGIGPWLAAPLVGMVAALVDVGRQSLTRGARAGIPTEGRGPRDIRDRPGRASTSEYGIGTRTKRRVPVLVGVLVAVLLIGGGGVAIAYGVATVTAFITGNQTGPDRLVGGPVTVDTQGVTTTVHRVEHTQDFTRVEDAGGERARQHDHASGVRQRDTGVRRRHDPRRRPVPQRLERHDRAGADSERSARVPRASRHRRDHST